MMNRTLVPSLAFAVLMGCAAAEVPRPETLASDMAAVPQSAQAAPAPVVAAPSTSAAAETVLPAPAPVPAAGPRVLPLQPSAATAPRVQPAPAPGAPAIPERYVSLNFDNADISVVIQTIAELLQMNYIVAPAVRGRVTIQTSEKLPVSALFPVLEQILEVNNFMAVKSGNFFKIVPSSQAKQEAVETVLPEAAASVAGGLVTKIVRLRFISPGEVVKILTPFKTAAGVYQSYEAARLLFLTEPPAKIADLLKIVEVLDVDTFAAIHVELYPVRFVGVEELARELTQIVTLVYSSAGRGRALFRIVPVTQVNAIMVFSDEPSLAANIREWVGKLDQPASEANERIFVYPLSHADAEALAVVLEKVFRRDATASQPRSGSPVSAQPSIRTGTPTGQSTGASAATGPPPTLSLQIPAASGTSIAPAGAATVVIVADKDTNTLIIQTASWFYPTVEQVIRKLDVMPKQVLIEVLIAEISLDDTNQFGIQWALKGQGTVNAFGEAHSLTSTTQSVYDSTNGIASTVPGFSVFLTEANRLTAALNAYAKDSKLNILSAPHILATNNKEAKIDVGSEIPILTTKSTSTADDGTSDTITNDIEYRSTGVILTVTPHINEGGFVTLDVQQEVSEAQTNSLGGTDSPIINKRTAKTTMVVKDNQTLVVGGLIQEKRDSSREGLPGLSKIPILGYLFGSTTAKVSKTELVLLITPRVVNDVGEGEELTRQVRERVLTLKKGIERFGALEGQKAP